MLERIIVLGDSYTYGHGCEDRVFYMDPDSKKLVGKPTMGMGPSAYCWATLIEKEYKIEVKNLAQCGHSNSAMFRDLINFSLNDKSHKQTLVIFAGTSPDRIEISGANGGTHSWVLSQAATAPFLYGEKSYSDLNADQYALAKKMYLTHLYQKNIGTNLGLMAMLGSKQYCDLRGFHFNYSLPEYWYDRDTINHLYNVTKLNNLAFQDIQSFDYSGKNNHWENINIYKCKDNHTNEVGHEVYFNKIIVPLLKKYYE